MKAFIIILVGLMILGKPAAAQYDFITELRHFEDSIVSYWLALEEQGILCGQITAFRDDGVKWYYLTCDGIDYRWTGDSRDAPQILQ